MYKNLRGEMVKKDLTISKLAEKIGISEKTLRNKIHGETEFTWPEICKIHRLVNPKMSKDELFAKEEQTLVRQNDYRTNVCACQWESEEGSD